MKTKQLRYIVTGPGLTTEPSYADAGPALSRTLTEASKIDKGIEATFYARDSVLDKIVGYTEITKLGAITTRRNP